MINTVLKLTKLAQIEDVIKLLRAEISAVNIPEETFYDIQLAITEAVSNAFLHGTRGCSEDWVELEWWIENNSTKVRIKDNGEGFNYSRAGELNLNPEAILAEHGKGLFLIFSVVDDVWFNDKGNEIYCLKKW
ncbi:MAG: ATP-binding protein [Peptococcaceae bacterium]